MQHHVAELRVFLEVLVQTEDDGLDSEVSEAVGRRGEHVGDAWVHGLTVPGVGGQPFGDDAWSDNVPQVIPEGNHLTLEWKGANCEYDEWDRLKRDLCWYQSYLEVPPHDFAGLLVQPLAAPVGVELSESAGQPVMFPHQQRVQGSQRNILVGSFVTLET